MSNSYVHGAGIKYVFFGSGLEWHGALINFLHTHAPNYPNPTIGVGLISQTYAMSSTVWRLLNINSLTKKLRKQPFTTYCTSVVTTHLVNVLLADDEITQPTLTQPTLTPPEVPVMPYFVVRETTLIVIAVIFCGGILIVVFVLCRCIYVRKNTAGNGARYSENLALG